MENNKNDDDDAPVRNRVRITSDTSSAYHVQHAVRHLVRRDRSAMKLNRVEIVFVLDLFFSYWMKPLTDEGVEETGLPGENPRRRASENATY